MAEDRKPAERPVETTDEEARASLARRKAIGKIAAFGAASAPLLVELYDPKTASAQPVNPASGQCDPLFDPGGC